MGRGTVSGAPGTTQFTYAETGDPEEVLNGDPIISVFFDLDADPDFETEFRVASVNHGAKQITLEAGQDLAGAGVQDGDPFVAEVGLDPTSGLESDTYTYYVVYEDDDDYGGVRGNPPDYVSVFIDNVQNAMVEYDSSDTNMTDGKIYYFSTSSLSVSENHQYYFMASDGLDTVRNPAVAPSQYDGPTVHVNGPPELSSGTVTPASAGELDAGGDPQPYTFEVIYTDPDNHAPSEMKVHVLNTSQSGATWKEFPMTRAGGGGQHGDGAYTNGELYTLDAYAFNPGNPEIGDGHHEFYFTATDTPGLSTRLPSGTSTNDGPTINDAPESPDSGFDPASPAYASDNSTSNLTVIDDDTPRISWDAAEDPNATDTADTLNYVLELSETKTFSTVKLTLTSADGDAFVDVPIGDALDDNTAYFYRVRTEDDDGVQSPWNYDGGDPFEAETAFLVKLNHPPYWDDPALGDFAPSGEVNTLTPTLSWPDGADPDSSDPPSALRYQLEVDDNDDFNAPEYQSGWLGAGVTSHQVAAGHLSPGVDYYWRVKISDGDAESGWTSELAPPVIPTFHTVDNHAPTPPTSGFDPAADINSGEVQTRQPTFKFGAGSDPDPTDPPDTLHYEIEVDSDDDWSDGVNLAAGDNLSNVGETEVVLSTAELPEDQDGVDDVQYFWRVRTIDDMGEPSDWSAVQTFWLNTRNEAPRAPSSGFQPRNGAVTDVQQPTLEWNAASDPDLRTDTAAVLQYVVQLSTDDSFGTVAHQYSTNPGETQLLVGDPLTDLTTWYWRVRTVDDEGAQSGWSLVQYFRIDTENQPPTLSDPTLDPVYGELATTFEFSVVYTDPEGDAPIADVELVIEPTGLTRAMERDPNDTDGFDQGVTYLTSVRGDELGMGDYTHYFQILGQVRLPDSGNLPGPNVIDTGELRLADSSWANVTEYEEGDDVYIEVTDADENTDPGSQQAITITVAPQDGSDIEHVQLEETGDDTGVFRGQVAMLGRAGSSDDGQVNLIAGPSGQQVVAKWEDPGEVAFGAAPAQDTAMVTDTVAPDVIAASELTVQSLPAGTGIAVDWTGYDEDAQVDVAGYHVWHSTSDFSDTADAELFDTVSAGTQTYDAEGLALGSTHHFGVTAFDEVPNENTAVNTKSDSISDTAPPHLANQDPAEGATSVDRNADIYFEVIDEATGVVEGSIEVYVDDTDVTTDITKTAVTDGFSVSYDPPSPFDWNAVVQVRVLAEDNAGNGMDETYVFSTTEDTTPPQLTSKNYSAEDGSISFHLTDDISGIDTASLVLQVDGTDVTADTTIDDSDPLDVVVSYTAPGGWPYSTQVEFTVDVSDNAGNAMPTETWSEDTPEDNAAPTFDQRNPADGMTNVPVATSISVRVRDSASGVDPASITMTVNGEDVSDELDTGVTTAANGGPAEVVATYEPAEDLDWETEYTIHVEASDTVGNTGTDEWSFTTEPQPTYEVRGTITDADGDPLPGVEVTADGTTVGTDGNGMYRIQGLVAGTYTVTPSLPEYDFEPASQEVTLGPTAKNIDFVGTLRTYTISGRVADDGEGIENVVISADGVSATTDADGYYTIEDVPSDVYTLAPSRDDNGDGFEDFIYTPRSRTVSVEGADVTGIDFSASPVTYTISGVISDSRGHRIAGVTVSDGTRTAVTTDAGRYTLSGVAASTVTVTPSKAGLAFDPESLEVTVPPDSSGNDFTAYTEFTHRFRAGLSMVAVPAQPPSGRDRAVDIFGTDAVARWDAAAVPPHYISGTEDPDHLELRVRPGAGFFVNLPSGTDVVVPGDPVDGTGTFSVGVSTGWNMIGNMYETALPLANITAAGSTEIRPFAFIYDREAGSYKMISRDPAINSARNYIEAWESAWFKATGAAGTLNIAAPTGVSSASLVEGQAASTEVSEDGWLLPIVARAAGQADLTTVAGVGSGAASVGYRVANPPMLPGTVDVYLVTEDGERLAHDIRPQAASEKTVWTFAVETDVPDAEVELLLPDLSAVPNDLAVYLTDRDSGQRMYARTLPSYVFTAGPEGALRHFELEVAPRGAENLVIRSASAECGSAGVVVTYDVSAACNVSIEVLNIAGRKVRQMVESRAASAGRNEQVWDLRSAEGTVVPNGTYLIKIEAVAENGQYVQALQSAQVTR
ncbi:MAG: carboxypeptidase regulatory-like domain-containing protein [Armatimonadota bacterium]|nr:carboxypeptidase regulatory-like domain-containing protein [Armatimonadota bacterium]